MKAFLPALALLSSLAIAAFGQQEIVVPEVRLPLMEKAPVIANEAIDPAQWTSATRMERLNQGQRLAHPGASFWVGATPEALYLAVRSEIAPGGKLLRRANPIPGEVNALVLQDDVVEIYISPNPDDAVENRRTYQAIYNARAAGYTHLMTGRGGNAWLPTHQIGNHVGETTWDFTIAIPWRELGVEKVTLPSTMGIRIARTWHRTANGTIQAEWSPLGGNFTSLTTLPRVTWEEQAPVIQVEQLQATPGSTAEVRYLLRNPGPKPLHLRLESAMLPVSSAPTRLDRTVTLAPGEETRLSGGTSAALAGEQLFTHLKVSDAAAGTVFYQRTFHWSIDRPPTLWKSDDGEAGRLTFSHGYYPSLNLVTAKLDSGSQENPAGLGEVKLALYRVGSKEPLATTTFPPFRDGQSELTGWSIPELEDGSYELIATGKGGAPLKGSFQRQRFEWEGNQRGLSEVVVPPFTPLEVEGERVRSVLREHRLNGVGLWDQVEAAGEALLSGPMRLEVVSAGGARTEANGSYKVLEAKGHRVTSEARWEAGPLRGTTRATWDYDGTMKTALTLEPTQEEIERVTLIIPVEGELAPFLHACTDGIRFNYAGKMPEGEGVIWKSSQASRQSIIGSYVPYLWIGGTLRGLSVFGDNDKGWITSPDQPTQELVRTPEGGVEMHFHLVARKAQWKEPREITLGFLATPVKPMAEGWRQWTVGTRGKEKAGVHQAFLGSCPYWGTVSNYQDLYPRDYDFTYFEEMVKARETGEMPLAFIKNWLEGYRLTGTPEQQETRQKFYERHVHSGFRVMANKPDHVLPYTNPRGTRFDAPEGVTFLNEWHREAFPQREWGYGMGHSYDIDPVPSFRDYSAWYWVKILETFADAIYWDNIFMQSSFSPANPAAYRLEDGRVQPASGIWNMREIVRRGMVLSHEMGRPNRNMVHITNTAIAPIVGFAGSLLTWEDRGGDSDFQERFPRDYVLTESIGRQFGALPTVLTSHVHGNDPVKKARAYRTAAGVLLTHEMKTISHWSEQPDPFWENYDRLIAFGYGTPEVAVHTDWESGFPLEIGGKTSALLLVREGKALLVVCDWGAPGEITVTPSQALLAKLPEGWQVRNLESGEVEAKGEAGRFTIKLEQHDFKVLELEAP